MRKLLTLLQSGWLLVALLWCGCDHSHDAASRSRLAAEKSNLEAKRLFNMEPFEQGDGKLKEDGTAWEALTSSRGKDMIAKVTFDDHGSVVNVDVKMLTQPATEPVTNVGPSVDSDRQFQQKSVIPEVMPK